MGSSPRTSLLRLSAPIEDLYRRRSQRSKFKDSHKPFFNLSGAGKISSKCKFPLLKFVLLVIVTGIFIALAYSPDIYNHNRPSNLASRWIWGGNLDTRYVSDSEINWDDMSKITKRLNLTEERPVIGILNFNSSEIEGFKRVVGAGSEVRVLNLDHVGKDVTWESLYPEWIDEEEEEAVPVCPKLPDLKPPRNMRRIGVVVAKLPCGRRSGRNWSRDVARLHLQLAAAGLAAAAGGPHHHVRVVFVTECFPIPNLFTCRELVAREGHVWLYEPDLVVLRHKVNLPVGSCQLSLRLPTKGVAYSDNNSNKSRQAYVTILHSANAYVCGAIAAAQSIRMSGSTRDLVILVDDTISSYHRSGLEAAGWKIKTIERIRNPKAEKDSYNEWNYSKFRLWQLGEDYDKIIFVDADLLVLRNIDFLFSAPEISATGNDGTLFNSGVMVVEPSECTFDLLASHVGEFDSYNGGDQGYLNEIFTHWHRVPKRVNFLKNFWSGDDDRTKAKKSSLFASDPPELHVIHYLGLKPWLCFRDYDCNWNVDILREFASDAAHRRWWRLHDRMAPQLQEFCLLKTKQKAQLEFDRRQAQAGNFSDGHWRRLPVKDRRLRRCVDGICDWRDMLKHWGETNWTDADFSAPTPPAIRSAAVPFYVAAEDRESST